MDNAEVITYSWSIKDCRLIVSNDRSRYNHILFVDEKDMIPLICKEVDDFIIDRQQRMLKKLASETKFHAHEDFILFPINLN